MPAGGTRRAWRGLGNVSGAPPPGLSHGVCVVGMHRSGTSLAMQVLTRLGLEIGPEDSLVPTIAEDNPDGYFEQQAFVALDDELLAALGGHVSDPGPAPAGWHTDLRFAPHRARADVLVATTFGRSPWGWKDPRASLLLPFWRCVIPALRVIICVRNPAEVAASMLRRHAHPPWEHWLRMWLRHTADALSGSAGAERIVLVYENLLTAPEDEARRLGTFLYGVEPPLDRVQAAAAAVRPGTRRHRATDRALIQDPRTPPEVAAAYVAVRGAVRAGDDLADLTALFIRLHAALNDRDATTAELGRAQGDRDAHVVELEDIRRRHALVLASRSWRLTAPLRSVGRCVRNLS